MEASSWYFAGNVQYGQCGLFIDENKLVPDKMRIPCSARQMRGGGRHAALIGEDGLFYTWGDNQKGQLGRSKNCKPNPVPALEIFVSTVCSLGTSHSAVITNNGTLLTFGSNESGELGIGSTDQASDKPRAIHTKSGNSLRFVNVSCGDRFTYAISEDGKIYSWGLNWNGQLGRGDFLGVTIPDVHITSLETQAIKSIACGQSHAVFLSFSGFLFSCGSNSFGELGHGDNTKRVRPTLIQNQDSTNISFCAIASGSFHNLAVTLDGDIYSWGSSSHGQLGHGLKSSVASPTRIEFFNNEKLKIFAIAAGSRHSIAITDSLDDIKPNRYIFSWGCGASGQLGHGNTISISLPQKIIIETYNIPTNITCGSEFTIIGFNNEPITETKNSSVILHFVENEIKQLGKTNISHLYHKIQVVFSSPSCLNASFLDTDPNSQNFHHKTQNSISGVHMPTVRQSFKDLVHLYEQNSTLMNVLANSTAKLVQKLQNFQFSHPATLRVFLILIEVPWMLQIVQYNVVLENLTRAIVGLNPGAKQILKKFWTNLSSEFATRVLHVFKGYLEFLLSSTNLDRTIISSVVLVLDLLHQSTHISKQISHESFAVPLLVQRIDLQQDFENWKSSAGRVFSFCDYPFLFNSSAKQKLLSIEASLQMREQVFRALLQQSTPCLELSVHRDRVFDEVMNELVNYISGLDGFSVFDLKKPLVVKFFGEDGIDDGGLRRELFFLLTEKIFDTQQTDLFQLEFESYLFWFTSINHSIPHSKGSVTFPMETQYKLVGMIIGMAIYNHVLLNLQFPSAIYRFLLNKPLRLKDLIQLRPSLGKGLQQLMDMSEDEIEECNLYFEVPDAGKVRELGTNGSNIRVSKVNVGLYVQLYCKYVLFDSVELQMTALREGFWLACDGKAMKLLHPGELELFVCGSPKLDFHELEKVTNYEGGFSAKSQVILWFWEEVHSWSYEQKRNFLLFVTGAPRAPILGLSQMKFTIQRSGPHSARLPVAHTCYNILDLPEYTTRTDLKEKLQISIHNFQGFGIV